MNSHHFVPSTLRYMCAQNYFNVKSFGRVIAKTKGCSFLGHIVVVMVVYVGRQ